MVFKKDLTPLSKKGTVDKQNGKGSAVYRPDAVSRFTNKYPKTKSDVETGMPSPFGVSIRTMK